MTTSIAPKEWDITVVKGDKQPPVTFTLKDSAGNDITGYTFKMEVWKARNLVQTWQGNSDGADFEIDFTNEFDAAAHYHFLQVTLSNGWTFTIVAGTFTVIRPYETGATKGFGNYTITLPIVFNSETGTAEFSDDFSPIDFKLN